MKIEKLVMTEGTPGYFQPGITRTEDGLCICTEAAGKEVCLTVFEDAGEAGETKAGQNVKAEGGSGAESGRIWEGDFGTEAGKIWSGEDAPGAVQRKMEESGKGEDGEDVCEKSAASRSFRLPESARMGNMWCVKLLGDDFSGLTYSLTVDGREIPDPFGRSFTGRETWGELSHVERPLRSPLAPPCPAFDWEGDRPLQIPYEDVILYRIHTRGLTMHPSAGKDISCEPGTFRAIAEKIPYFKELGVTSLELMPPNEFEEVMMPERADGNPYGGASPTGKLNYWGYAPGLLFAPKASYSCGAAGEKDPVREFKELVKKLHRNGLELIIELYFTGKEGAAVISEAVRFWAREYHVDGVHLVGIAACPSLRDDPWLAGTKLFAACWEEEETAEKRHLAEYNDGFLVDMRRFLKGDEDQLNRQVFRNRRNPKGFGVINYMANTNGFTLMDAVSYEMKHNEENGENNQDGSEWNYTWNCGVEGPSRKKKVAAMRKKQIRNAFLLLLLSQGTPLFLSGDEFGSTKRGNNNSYCQDNEISWLDWGLLKDNGDIFRFVKAAIAFRKKHPVFHMSQEPKGTDYLACGHPDISYHGVRAWCPEFENFRRQIGIMYCGDYVKREDGSQDDYFFTAYNMHWEPHEFALPKLPRGMKWRLAFNTDDGERNGVYPEGEEPRLEQQKQFLVPARTVAVFIGLREDEKGEKPEKKTAKSGKKAAKSGKKAEKPEKKSGKSAGAGKSR